MYCTMHYIVTHIFLEEKKKTEQTFLILHIDSVTFV